MSKIRVLFVCMGNICRSPTAEGVFVSLLEKENLLNLFEVDSAGTHAYHVGEVPDHRARKAAEARGIRLDHIRARKVTFGDFDDFDFLLAMDEDNYTILRTACPEPQLHKVYRLLDFAPELNTRNVPDPYYGGKRGFERVLDLVEAGSRGFIEFLREQGRL